MLNPPSPCLRSCCGFSADPDKQLAPRRRKPPGSLPLQEQTDLIMKSMIIKTDLPPKDAILKGLHRRLGYGEHTPEDIVMLIQHALNEIQMAAHPVAIFRRTPLREIGNNAIRGEGLLIESSRWSGFVRQMDSPEIILAYAVTLGADIDHCIASMQKRSLSLAYITDAAGSEAVERIADHVADKVWNMEQLQEYERTALFSPGYCDWPLAGQREIFSFLKPAQIGIDHTTAWSLTPAKTITAIVMGARGMHSTAPCSACSEQSCSYRRD